MPLGALRPRLLVLVAWESVSILGAVLLAAWIRLGSDVPEFLNGGLGFFRPILITATCQLCLYYSDLYDLRTSADRRDTFARLFDAFMSSSLILAFVYYWFPALVMGRGVFAISVVLILVSVVMWRVAYQWLYDHVWPRERVLLVGAGPGTVTLARELYERRTQYGVEIVGFIDTDPAAVGQPVINPTVIGVVDDIPRIVREQHVDRVVVSLSDARRKLPMDWLLEIKMNDGVTFDHLASVYEEYTGKIAIENLRPSWFIFSSGFTKSTWVLSTKRAMDVSAALVGFVLAAPVMAVVAAAIKLTSPGAALYHQRRVGHGGKVFTVHKFRSMHQDAEAATGAVWAHAYDTRVTPIGRLLRKTRLDELPQLWNVLVGEMSLVGPRPERPEFVGELKHRIPFYGERHVVKPGLTGWAQVRFPYGASVEDAMEKLQFDLFYIKNLSIALDCFILFETVKIVILRRGT